MTLEEAKQILNGNEFPKTTEEVNKYKEALQLLAGSFVRVNND